MIIVCVLEHTFIPQRLSYFNYRLGLLVVCLFVCLSICKYFYRVPQYFKYQHSSMDRTQLSHHHLLAMMSSLKDATSPHFLLTTFEYLCTIMITSYPIYQSMTTSGKPSLTWYNLVEVKFECEGIPVEITLVGLNSCSRIELDLLIRQR